MERGRKKETREKRIIKKGGEEDLEEAMENLITQCLTIMSFSSIYRILEIDGKRFPTHDL